MSTSCGLHPNWVFFKDCHVCSNQNNVGCPTKEGRKNVYLFILRHYYPSTNNNLFFFCFSDMAGGFAQCHEAQRLAHKAAIRNIESNPARNVERSTILAVVATSEDTVSTPPPATPWENLPKEPNLLKNPKAKTLLPQLRDLSRVTKGKRLNLRERNLPSPFGCQVPRSLKMSWLQQSRLRALEELGKVFKTFPYIHGQGRAFDFFKSEENWTPGCTKVGPSTHQPLSFQS